MSTINNNYPYSQSVDKVRESLVELAQQLQRDYKLKSQWQGNTIQFQRRGVSGSITIGEEKLNGQIKLGLLLTPFEGKIRKQISAFCSQNL